MATKSVYGDLSNSPVSSGTGTVTAISAGSTNIVLTPNPITTIGSVDTGNSIQLGSRLDTLGKDGILDIPVANTSSFTGIAATGNSLINMEGNTYSGPAIAVVVAGGGAGGNKNTINNVTNSVVAGISHVLTGGASGLVVTGYNNTVTGGANQVVGGQQNTITNGTAVDCNGVSNSISNTIGASVTGQQNSISGGVTNKIGGNLNGITTGVRCSAFGYSNSITTASNTYLMGYQNLFTGSGATDINFLFGFQNALTNALAHRFNMIWGENFGNRAATVCEGVKALCVGAPSTSFDNGAGKICTPAGLESSGTVVIFGNQVAIGAGGGEVRIWDVNAKSSVVPTTGDEYCNKTYVDGVVSASKGYTIGNQTLVALNIDVSAASSSGSFIGGTFDQFVYTVGDNPQTVSFNTFPFNQFTGNSIIHSAGAETRFMKATLTGRASWTGAVETAQLTYDFDLYNGATYMGHVCRIESKELATLPSDAPLNFTGELVVQGNFNTALWVIQKQWNLGDGAAGKTLNLYDLVVTYEYSPNNYINL